jgi:hypothetical protein
MKKFLPVGLMLAALTAMFAVAIITAKQQPPWYICSNGHITQTFSK